MSDTFIPFKAKKYLAIAKEPVFVGTGGYRIGRVDNTIVRDPATNLPKIPGSTISGNARYYSWLSYKSEGMNLNLGCSKGKKTEEQDPCGECPVCLTYGFVKDKKAHSGLAYFSDARILFFPVSTMIGTVWLTSDEILKEFVETGGDEISVENNSFLYSQSLESSLPKNDEGKKFLNFGWIMLKASNSINPEIWKIKKDIENDEITDLSGVLNRVGTRICVVSKDVFHHIVNSNLETRTSVSINPITGAAESGALFTYEALPRGAVFILDVTYENPSNYMKDESIEIVIGTVEKGFKLFSSLGIGGMGTRGFGKIEIIDNWLGEKEYLEKLKEFIGKLNNNLNELETKISKIKQEIEDEQDNKKKEELIKEKNKLEKEKQDIEEKKSLWIEYVEKVKKQKEADVNNENEILDILKEILSSSREANNE
ncbi:type III-B CRISPR module RAMP protein Cmr4 [Desulfurobacterium atlanticum]|uniref:CRISPR-associated protein Cmr4 n=1 Tax=Desulfurobacterium atlanticum TaxID=240169 RepID=A0A239A3D8_9BACT|nr:type III-B CRISPR module RAMP protein Cmr4 [Desulfurobacterium atlanticum]SNR89544.1 CRISPR-associated protein Cmr4 [Desulfurobacterium atlanticum]